MRIIDADVWINQNKAIVNDPNASDELKDHSLYLINEIESQVAFQQPKEPEVQE